MRAPRTDRSPRKRDARSHRMTPWALVVGALVLAACGGDDGLDYDGVAGRPTPASFAGWVPSIDASADGIAGTLLLDSGAPLTLLDNDHFTGLPDGEHTVDLAAGELRFPGLPVLAFDVVNYEQSREPALDGLIGGDVLGAFAASFDYAGSRIWLEDAESELPAGVDGTTLDDAIEVEAEIAGGGLIGIPGATREVGATRFLVHASIEDLADPVWVLIDTGASSVVLANRIAGELPAEGRPRLDGITVGTAAGALTAYFTRVSSVPVLVLPDDSIFDALSQETGRGVAAVVGGSYLRWFLATLDYPDQVLVLRRYRDPSHIDPDEFIGVGFEIEPSANQWQVSTVYPGTDAEGEGLEVGDVVYALDGTDIGGLSASAVDELVAGFELGDELPVLFDRAGTMTDALVQVEDLLPEFVSP
jgi:hypothetical protein